MVDIKVKKNGATCCIELDGDMTIYEARELKDRLVSCLDTCDALEVNLSRVSEIDTAGIQVLMLTKLESQRRAKSLQLISHSKATLDMLDSYQLAGFFGDPLVLASNVAAG